MKEEHSTTSIPKPENANKDVNKASLTKTSKIMLDDTPKEQNNSTYSPEKFLNDSSRILVLADTDEYSITTTIAPTISPGIVSGVINGITPTFTPSIGPNIVNMINNSSSDNEVQDVERINDQNNYDSIDLDLDVTED